jgi:hypothetical protein
MPHPRENDQFRQRVSQDLWVCVDDAGCIVIESVGAGTGQVMARKTVTDVGRLKEKLDLAREFVTESEAAARAARYAGLQEKAQRRSPRSGRS